MSIDPNFLLLLRRNLLIIIDITQEFSVKYFGNCIQFNIKAKVFPSRGVLANSAWIHTYYFSRCSISQIWDMGASGDLQDSRTLWNHRCRMAECPILHGVFFMHPAIH
jgi:hypothetical protein